MPRVDALSGELRTDAATLRRWGDVRGADLLEAVADRVDAALRDHDAELLDLRTAARESGYSPDRLRHMLADGTVPNSGRKGAPRVRRGDLPNRPARAPAAGAYDPAADALRLLTPRGRHNAHET